jgi:hypothetical protein
MPLTWAFVVERVRGIEPPLSAWESHRRPAYADILGVPKGPEVTAVHRCGPTLMARQWPSADSAWYGRLVLEGIGIRYLPERVRLCW